MFLSEITEYVSEKSPNQSRKINRVEFGKITEWLDAPSRFPLKMVTATGAHAYRDGDVIVSPIGCLKP